MSPGETSEIKDEALRKIGRNVVNFQKIEGMLKLLLSRREFRGPISEFESKLDKQRQEVEHDSLGKLAKNYFEYMCSESEIETDWSSLEKTHFGMSFRIIAEKETLPVQREDFQCMVSERNRLIHQMLVGFNPDSIESCRDLIAELDKQNETIMRHYKNLQNALLAFQEGMNQLAKNVSEDNY
jgi:hypothetical protein